MIVKCPKCGNLVSDKVAFCVNCGTPISAATPETAAPAEPTPTPTSPAPTVEVEPVAPAPQPAVSAPVKKVNVNTILLSVILALLVVGDVLFLVLRNSSGPRAIPEGIETYDVGSYNTVADEIVYSHSYDGYLSIRDTPSSKGVKIGKFRNGPEGAIKLSESGNWVEIDYNGIVGYVSKKHVVTYPTKAVTVDIDEKWLAGPWYPAHRNYAYMIFNNGTYTVQYEYGTLAYGTYQVEGDEIIFSATMLANQGYDVGSYERHKITVSPKRIGPLTKRSLIKEDDRWKHYGELVWTWAEYAQLKKQTRENVRL